jgi:hypothetical protein
MFGIFKKNKTYKKTMPKRAEVNPIISTNDPVSLEELMEIVDKKWTSNAFASIYFAQCGGFAHTVIGYEETNILKYNEIILLDNPNGFSSSDKINALNLFVDPENTISRKFLDNYKRFDPKIMAQTMFELTLLKRENDWQKLTSKIDEKFEYIGPIFQRLLNSSIDKYGEMDFGPILDEMDEFINRFFNENDFDFYYRFRPVARLTDYIEEKLKHAAHEQITTIPLDGIEFEHWTANELNRQGWQVQVSQASGDQGLDVMARREGCSVAIQCKRYTKPIGNKAVQEVYAAKQFTSADYACVIGTGGFTSSARELAGATGVMLIEAEAGLQNFSNSFGMDSEILEVDESDDVALEFNFDANSAAKKAIIQSFFSIQGSIKDVLDAHGDDTPDIPDVLLDNFDPVSGEGSATLDANDLITLLTYSDLHLSGKADMSDEVREQFRSSDTLWQQKIGEDESIMEINGILAYGLTTPEEIKEEFCSLWDLCEMFVGFESDDPYRQALNKIYRERMEKNRPKLMDTNF